LRGYISSYFDAINMVVTPMMCKSETSLISYLDLKYLSNIETERKKV